MQLPAHISTITPDRALKILQENGLSVTLEEAAPLLDFLVKLAEHTLKNEDCLPIHPRVD